jgi:hypothetical protein
MPSLGDIWGLREGLEVVIQLNNNGQPVGLGSEKLSQFGSLLVKITGLPWTSQTKRRHPKRRHIKCEKSCE